MGRAYRLSYVILIAEGLDHSSHEFVVSYSWTELLQILYWRADRRDASGYHRFLYTIADSQNYTLVYSDNERTVLLRRVIRPPGY